MFHEHLKKLAVIFQVLQHVNDFQTTGYGGHFVFEHEAIFLNRHVFIAINIPCKCCEDVSTNK